MRDTSKMAKSRTHAAEFRSALRRFQLFGHPIRAIIFQRLTHAPMTAGELAQELPIERAAVVQHLKLLEAADLLSAKSEGKRRIYQSRAAGLKPLVRWLDQQAGARDA